MTMEVRVRVVVWGSGLLSPSGHKVDLFRGSVRLTCRSVYPLSEQRESTDVMTGPSTESWVSRVESL